MPTFGNHPLVNKILREQTMLIGLAVVISLIQSNLTLPNIGSIWALIGLGSLTFAAISTFGAWSSVRSPEYQILLTMNGDINQGRIHTANELNSVFYFFFNTFGNAMIAIVLGLMLNFVFT